MKKKLFTKIIVETAHWKILKNQNRYEMMIMTTNQKTSKDKIKIIKKNKRTKKVKKILIVKKRKTEGAVIIQ